MAVEQIFLLLCDRCIRAHSTETMKATDTLTNIDFQEFNLDKGVFLAPGKHEAVNLKVLSDAINHHAKSGWRARVLRIELGFQSFGQHDHPYCDELLMLKSSLYKGATSDAVTKRDALSFVRRGPRHMHDPAGTHVLTSTLEINCYDDKYKSADMVADGLVEIPS